MNQFCVVCLRGLDPPPAPGQLPLCGECHRAHLALSPAEKANAGTAIVQVIETRRQNETLHRLEASLTDVLRQAASRAPKRRRES